MSLANVLIYLALIGYVLYGKAKGWPMKTPRKLFLLPVLIVIIGYGDATHGTMKPFEIGLTVVGGIISLGLGLLRGRADKISTRDGSQFVQWGGLSFALFGTNLVMKLILDLVGVASGSTFSAVGKSLVLTLGLTLVGEAIALFVRSGAASGALSSDRSASFRAQFAPMQPPTADWSDRRVPSPGSPGLQSRTATQSPSRRDGAASWLRQQIDQPRSGPARSVQVPLDEVRSDGHHHHDHDHHHNHHGLTGPS